MIVRFQLWQHWFICLLLLLIVLLSVSTIFGERGVLHLWRLGAEKAKLDDQNHQLQQENHELRQRIDRLRHDDFYLEKIAREELNLVRPGEVIYRFTSTESRKSRGGLLTAPPGQQRPSEARTPRR